MTNSYKHSTFGTKGKGLKYGRKVRRIHTKRYLDAELGAGSKNNNLIFLRNRWDNQASCCNQQSSIVCIPEADRLSYIRNDPLSEHLCPRIPQRHKLPYASTRRQYVESNGYGRFSQHWHYRQLPMEHALELEHYWITPQGRTLVSHYHELEWPML